jgi:hypothetical protein
VIVALHDRSSHRNHGFRPACGDTPYGAWQVLTGFSALGIAHHLPVNVMSDPGERWERNSAYVLGSKSRSVSPMRIGVLPSPAQEFGNVAVCRTCLRTGARATSGRGYQCRWANCRLILADVPKRTIGSGRFVSCESGADDRHDADGRKETNSRRAKAPAATPGLAIRHHATASLAAFTGRALTIFRAGFALKVVGSLVKGLMP